MTDQRKKVKEAHRWFMNGDHPLDDRETFTDGQGILFLGEGKIVRYYRHPDRNGRDVCKLCGVIMHDHGWIDSGEYGHNVCPGDWIITDVDGNHFPCKPDAFETYDELTCGGG